jgi:hypothetical protein
VRNSMEIITVGKYKEVWNILFGDKERKLSDVEKLD